MMIIYQLLYCCVLLYNQLDETPLKTPANQEKTMGLDFRRHHQGEGQLGGSST